jgi:hypothetical protein
LSLFNAAHFAGLHAAWMRQGRRHAGIVVSSQRPIGDTIRLAGLEFRSGYEFLVAPTGRAEELARSSGGGMNPSSGVREGAMI